MFAVTYRVSNTSHHQVFGIFPTLEEARKARKQAITSGFRAPPTATTQGKILCWNIEKREGE